MKKLKETRLLRLAAQASCLVVEPRFFSWTLWASEHEVFEKTENPKHVSEKAAQEVGDRSGTIAVVANKTCPPINSAEEVPRAPGTREWNPRPLRSPAKSQVTNTSKI